MGDNSRPQHTSLPSHAGGRGVGGEGSTLRERAKSLRIHQTDAEQRLWYHLRAHRFMNLKFKRQKPVGHYIVDFICHQPMLIVEVDGGQHAESLAYDRQRDAYLKQEGFSVLRFWNHQVLSETDAVLEAIRQTVLALSPSPSPASGRGELLGETDHAPTQVLSPLPPVGEGSGERESSASAIPSATKQTSHFRSASRQAEISS